MSIAVKPSDDTTPKVWRQVGALCASLAALALFGIGLIAPLTPSEGGPSLWALTIFVGGPLALTWLSYRWATSGLVRLMLGLEALLILAITVLLAVRVPWF